MLPHAGFQRGVTAAFHPFLSLVQCQLDPAAGSRRRSGPVEVALSTGPLRQKPALVGGGGKRVGQHIFSDFEPDFSNPRQCGAFGALADLFGRWPAPRDLNPQPPGSKPGALSS